MRAQMLGVALRGTRGGGGIGIVSISNFSETVETAFPDPATIEYILAQTGGQACVTDLDPWLIGSTNGAAYEVRVTPTSGTLSSGATGSWLALSAARSWSVTRSSLGSKTCTFIVEIGLVGTSTALDTASITMTAAVSS